MSTNADRANPDLIRALLKAYVDKDRPAAEALLAPAFSFTSPLDNALGRAAYFDICWPNSQNFESFDVCDLIEDGERVVMTYEATLSDGKRLRNVEIHIVREGLIASVEVYFGWNVPHEVPPGKHRDTD